MSPIIEAARAHSVRIRLSTSAYGNRLVDPDTKRVSTAFKSDDLNNAHKGVMKVQQQARKQIEAMALMLGDGWYMLPSDSFTPFVKAFAAVSAEHAAAVAKVVDLARTEGVLVMPADYSLEWRCEDYPEGKFAVLPAVIQPRMQSAFEAATMASIDRAVVRIASQMDDAITYMASRLVAMDAPAGGERSPTIKATTIANVISLWELANAFSALNHPNLSAIASAVSPLAALTADRARKDKRVRDAVVAKSNQILAVLAAITGKPTPSLVQAVPVQAAPAAAHAPAGAHDDAADDDVDGGLGEEQAEEDADAA